MIDSGVTSDKDDSALDDSAIIALTPIASSAGNSRKPSTDSCVDAAEAADVPTELQAVRNSALFRQQQQSPQSHQSLSAAATNFDEKSDQNSSSSSLGGSVHGMDTNYGSFFNPFSKLRSESVGSSTHGPSLEQSPSNVQQRGGWSASIDLADTRLGKGLRRAHSSIIHTISRFVNDEDLNKELLPHQEAAILIEYSRDGQELNMSRLSTTSRFCYRLRRRYRRVFATAAWSLIALHIFTRPVWTFEDSHHKWNDGSVYPSYQLPYLPFLASTLLTGACLAVLWCAWLLDFGFKRYSSISYLNWFFLFLLLVKTITCFVYLANSAAGEPPRFSTSPSEALMLLLVEPVYDQNISYLVRTLPKFALLMVALAAVVSTYTALGFLIFDPDSQEAIQYFNFFGTAVWNMLMVLNGSNWPTPMIPAFMENRAFCLYFYLYIIICGWGLLNLVLGFVYLFFRLEQRDIALRQEATRAAYLLRAFRVLDVDAKGYLTYEQTDALLEEIYRCYEKSVKFPTTEERHECILQLDIQSNNMIDERDFQYIEDKCFPTALKTSRAKKRKFKRYISAHVHRSKSQDEEEWMPHSSSLAARPSSLRPSAVLDDIGIGRQSYSQYAQQRSSAAAGGAAAITNSLQPSHSSASDLTRISDLQQSQVVPGAAVSGGAGAIHSAVPAAATSATARSSSIGTRPSSFQQQQKIVYFSKTMTEASDYAGNIEDPKVLDFYRSIEMDERLKRDEKQREARVSQLLANAAMNVDSIYFDIFCDSLLALLGVVFLAGATDNVMVFLYLSLMLLELTAKLLVKGGFRYLKSNRNSVDGAIAVSLLVTVLVRAATGVSEYTDRIGLRGLIMLRTLLFPRNVLVTNGFRAFRQRHRLAFTYAFHSAGHVTFMLLVLFVMLYCFAATGQSIFGGDISRNGSSGEQLDASEYGQGEYWPLNFNDLPSGMVTMFVLLMVNNMHVIASGFVAVRGQWSQVFFALWYAFGVLFLLNVVTAVFLNQFAGYLEKLSLQRRQAAEEDALRAFDEQQQQEQQLLLQQQQQLQSQLREDGTSVPLTLQLPDADNSDDDGVSAAMQRKKSPTSEAATDAAASDANAGVAAAATSDGTDDDTYLGVPRISGTAFMILNTAQLDDICSDINPENSSSSSESESQQQSKPAESESTHGAEEQRAVAETTATSAATVTSTSPNAAAPATRSKSPSAAAALQKSFSFRNLPLTPSKKAVDFFSSMISVSQDPDDDFEDIGNFAVLADVISAAANTGHDDAAVTSSQSMQRPQRQRATSERLLRRSHRSATDAALPRRSQQQQQTDAATTAFDSAVPPRPSSSQRSSSEHRVRSLTHVASMSRTSISAGAATAETHAAAAAAAASGAAGSADAATASSALFSNSIFASSSDRHKLQQWVAQQYRRSARANTLSSAFTERPTTPTAAATLSDEDRDSEEYLCKTRLSAIRESETSHSDSTLASSRQRPSALNAAAVLNPMQQQQPQVSEQQHQQEQHQEQQPSDRSAVFRRRSSASKRPVFTTRAQTLGVRDDQEDEFEDVDDLQADIVVDLDVHRADDLPTEVVDVWSTATAATTSAAAATFAAADNSNSSSSSTTDTGDATATTTTRVAADASDIIGVQGRSYDAATAANGSGSGDVESISAKLSRSLVQLNFLRQRRKQATRLPLPSSGASESILHWMTHSSSSNNNSSNNNNSSGDTISRQAKAAVLIQFARDGEEHSIFSSARGLFCFRLRTRLSNLFRVASFAFAALRFFERPLWTFYRDDWSDNAVYPTSGVYLLPPLAMLAIKLPMLLVLLFGLLLELGYKESSFHGILKYITPMRLMRYVLFCYCIAQIVMLLVAAGASVSSSGVGWQQLVTISSCCSILYVLWFNRRSLQKFKIVLHVVPRLSVVLLLFFLVVMTFAGVGPFVFDLGGTGGGSDDDGANSNSQQYFDSLSESAWSIFVAITSSDFPSQILPSYRNRRENCIFFITFMTIGAFGLLNLIVVVVLVEFQKAAVLASDIQRASRQVLLMRAFAVLDHKQQGFIDRGDIKLLLDELYQHYADFTKAGIPRGAARSILIDILDVDGDGIITLNDFLYFLDVTRIKLSIDSPRTFFELLFPQLSRSAAYLRVKQAVVKHHFDVVADAFVALLVVLQLLINYRDPYALTRSAATLMHLAVFAMLLEAAVKLIARGYRNYRRSFRNKVDAFIAITALLALLAGDSYGSEKQQRYQRGQHEVNGFIICVRILLMLRLILCPRNLRFLLRGRGLKKFARLLRRVFTKIYTLGMVFLCCTYIFASVGVFAYGGRISKATGAGSSLENSDFALNAFWGLNFNDFTSAWIVLFSCLHVSDFDVIATGFTATTSNYSRLYFMSWYITGVLLLLNILKSFFLGEFLALFVTRTDFDVTGSTPAATNGTAATTTAAAAGNGYGSGTSAASGGGRDSIDRLHAGSRMFATSEMSKQHNTNQQMRSRLIDRLNNNNISSSISNNNSISNSSINNNNDDEEADYEIFAEETSERDHINNPLHHSSSSAVKARQTSSDEQQQQQRQRSLSDAFIAAPQSAQPLTAAAPELTERDSHYSARDTFILESPPEDIERWHNNSNSNSSGVGNSMSSLGSSSNAAATATASSDNFINQQQQQQQLSRTTSEQHLNKIDQQQERDFLRSVTYNTATDTTAAAGSKSKTLGEGGKHKSNRYLASTANVKHLDGKEKDLLRNRIRDLAQSGAMSGQAKSNSSNNSSNSRNNNSNNNSNSSNNNSSTSGSANGNKK